MPEFRVNARDTDGNYVDGIVIHSESADTVKLRMAEIGYTDVEEPILIPAGAPVPEIQRVMDSMPGLIGGIDHALIDYVGKPVPFVLVLFSGTTAVHATNMGSGEEGMSALRAFVTSLGKQAEGDGDAAG